eukprot:gene22878-27649_t
MRFNPYSQGLKVINFAASTRKRGLSNTPEPVSSDRKADKRVRTDTERNGVVAFAAGCVVKIFKKSLKLALYLTTKFFNITTILLFKIFSFLLGALLATAFIVSIDANNESVSQEIVAQLKSEGAISAEQIAIQLESLAAQMQDLNAIILSNNLSSSYTNTSNLDHQANINFLPKSPLHLDYEVAFAASLTTKWALLLWLRALIPVASTAFHHVTLYFRSFLDHSKTLLKSAQGLLEQYAPVAQQHTSELMKLVRQKSKLYSQLLWEAGCSSARAAGHAVDAISSRADPRTLLKVFACAFFCICGALLVRTVRRRQYIWRFRRKCSSAVFAVQVRYCAWKQWLASKAFRSGVLIPHSALLLTAYGSARLCPLALEYVGTASWVHGAAFIAYPLVSTLAVLNGQGYAPTERWLTYWTAIAGVDLLRELPFVGELAHNALPVSARFFLAVWVLSSHTHGGRFVLPVLGRLLHWRPGAANHVEPFVTLPKQFTSLLRLASFAGGIWKFLPSRPEIIHNLEQKLTRPLLIGVACLFAPGRGPRKASSICSSLIPCNQRDTL